MCFSAQYREWILDQTQSSRAVDYEHHKRVWVVRVRKRAKIATTHIDSILGLALSEYRESLKPRTTSPAMYKPRVAQEAPLGANDESYGT